MGKFVVYAFCREDGTFYYIGKGSLKRARSKRNQGINPPVDKSRILILHSNLDEKTAFDYERKLILFYGRKDLGTGLLRNMTDGGEGVSGWVPNEEWRTKKSRSMKGENNPFYGKQHSQETKALLSAKKKGLNAGDKNPMYGIHLTGPLNPMYGKKRPDLAERNKENPTCLNKRWYTDGAKSLRCKEGEQPEGFYLGRPSIKKNNNAAKH
jgi:hypothetical protein